jgi:phenylpropionate dioxygenase-like ring-hydroxylating dioxygenase large terminal subunit
MELATTLKEQTVQSRVRQVGINPNYWYAVSWAQDLKAGKVISVTIWQQAIALYRDTAGQLHALNDACPHRGVALHKGRVKANALACRYHGWEFDGSGTCIRIPYLPAGQKLPCARVQSYPVQERYGLIWVFPGNPVLAPSVPLPEIPEFQQSGWLAVPVTVRFKAHFSICNENTMDVFHGVLHEELQGWFDPVLLQLKETHNSVRAEYQVSYRGNLARFLRLSDHADQVTTTHITIQFGYPHYSSSLQGLSSLYLMRLPISRTESKSFSLFFLKIRLPQWVLAPLAPLLRAVLNRFVFMRFIAQDAEMVASEQQTHLSNPHHRFVEINPAIIALQRLMVRQYEQYIQHIHASDSPDTIQPGTTDLGTFESASVSRVTNCSDEFEE